MPENDVAHDNGRYAEAVDVPVSASADSRPCECALIFAPVHSCLTDNAVSAVFFDFYGLLAAENNYIILPCRY